MFPVFWEIEYLGDATVWKPSPIQALHYSSLAQTSMADYREEVLQAVEKTGEVDTLSLAKKLGVNHQVLVGAVKSLQSLGDVSCFWFEGTKKVHMVCDSQ